MFDIKIDFEDIRISCININDIVTAQKWLSVQNSIDTCSQNNINPDDFFERYLESLISEGEIFLKICKNSKLIGLLKGRIEFKNPNEVWFQYLFLSKEYRHNGIGSKIISNLCSNFAQKNFFNLFFALVEGNDDKAINFLTKNKFDFCRTVQNYLPVNNSNVDMQIFKKIYKIS